MNLRYTTNGSLGTPTLAANEEWCCAAFQEQLSEDTAIYQREPTWPSVQLTLVGSGNNATPKVVVLSQDIGANNHLSVDKLPINYCPWCGQEIALDELVDY